MSRKAEIRKQMRRDRDLTLIGRANRSREEAVLKRTWQTALVTAAVIFLAHKARAGTWPVFVEKMTP